MAATLSAALALLAAGTALGEQPAIPTEAPQEALRRHQRVAERRKGVDVICHRGASEHAHENTLEAFRATFELGGDGNEFDIRATKDGVLVVFHDDMLDRLLAAYGDVSDYSWEELQRFSFRNPGRFGAHCRIPTLVEVFDLHRRYGGLMHLDIKRHGLDRAIADLLTRMDMWDQVGYCNIETGGVILSDPRLKLRRYKDGLYLDRGEVFPDAITAALKKPGDGLIVDDPRGVVLALGRKLGKLSTQPVAPRREAVPTRKMKLPSEAELIAILRNAEDGKRVAQTDAELAASGQRICTRAQAAEYLLAAGASSPEAFAALEERVRKRSLHKDWMFHGFDGAMALRSLIVLRTPHAIEMARLMLWRDDPALEPVIDPRWNNPRSWTDFRVKMVIFPALEKCPGPATEKLCRDYLALEDQDARKLGPPQFEEAARALLAVSPRTGTALELMRHRLQVVRGRAILDCLAYAREAWARTALEKGAPHALVMRTQNDEERTEQFDRDPGWEGHNNRSAVPQPRLIRQNFGFSNTAHAGGKLGEIGGLISPAAEAAYYAKQLPTKTFQDTLSASGTLVCTGRRFHALIGFFNADTVNEWRTPNTIALRISGRGDVLYAWLEYATGRWRAGGDSPQGFPTEPDPTTGRRRLKGFTRQGVHHWSLHYDPNGNNGAGVITADINGEKAVCHLAQGHKADGASFNRFGLLNVMKSAAEGGELWLGDLTINGQQEDLRRDPGWDGYHNRRTYTTSIVRPRFDFGYSATHHAGGQGRGELGGLVFRGDCRFPDKMASYADRLGELTLEKPLRASGKVCLKGGVTDSSVLLGFFHSKDSMRVNPSQENGLPESFLGISTDGPSREGFLFAPVYRTHGRLSSKAPKGAPHIYPDGNVHDWSLEYSPSAASGSGQITVTLDKQTVNLVLGKGHKSAGARFDRFGLITTWIDGNSQTIYFDDLTYTCHQE
jgi:hypothetical protein